MNNYHTHTTRCMHAIGSERDYIEYAIDSGMKELGFSDHGPWHYDSTFVSTMRMHERQLDNYIDTLKALREEYKDKISIKIGFEYEYFEDKMDWLKHMLQTHDVDYIILGNHYDRSDEYGCYYGWPLHSHRVVKRYVAQVIKGMETGLYSYVAHPDLVRCWIHDERNLAELEKICIKAKACDMPLEFNMLGYRTHRHYPNDAFFRLCAKHGNKVILGADAHEPRFLYDETAHMTAVAYLESLGIEIVDHIRFLDKTSFR